MNEDVHQQMRGMMGDQTEETSFAIWGAAASVTRAFDKVEVRLAPEANRIFVVIHLRWWIKRIPFKKFDLIKQIWLNKAIKNVKLTAPQGFNTLVYYGK
jgi:hypothetical protein